MNEWLRTVPDPRCDRKVKHELTEILVCIIMGFLAGKTKLRGIVRWSQKHIGDLRKHMLFPNGVPSLSTISRVLSALDEDMVSLAITNWIGEILNTRGIHIAIDGKGLRAAARKIQDERTPYILNAIDTATRLVIAQLAIPEKSSEISAIPNLLDIIEIEGSIITIDAIGTNTAIMGKICKRGGNFVLQVKKNCPTLYEELMLLFDGLEKEQKEDPDAFNKKYGDNYSKAESHEKNRERYEYRKFRSYSEADGISIFQEERPM